jgi:drug/metabolite transporter (DMT)-like permease
MTRLAATLIGGTAVAMWAALAALTATSGAVPPLQLSAMTFAIATVALSLGARLAGRNVLALVRQPLPVWILGVGGLFGYHALYFTALRNAPAAEASLIAYLWPLLIVVFSALLPGERLRWYHIAGGLAGFAGSALLITGGSLGGFQSEYAFGYAMAFACAFTWSGYSVLSRRFAEVPSDVVALFCGATAVLSLLSHLAFETTAWPHGMQWLSVLGLGLGPVGLAFLTWDIGVKKGDIKALGAASYATPLFSTLLLIALGMTTATGPILIACALIVGGAVLASGDFWSRKRS